MAASRFYAALSTLLFAAVCAYVGAALFTALQLPSNETVPAPAKSEGGELWGILLRREEKAPADMMAAEGERLPVSALVSETAVFSSRSDGYELSPEIAAELSPETLKSLMLTEPTGSGGPRLIYGFDCYYAAFYSGPDNIEPGPCRLRFEGDTHRAELLSVSRSGTDCMLLFRLMLAPELLELRFCRAELIY